MGDDDAAVIRNTTLQESIRRNRREQLELLLDIQRELARVGPAASCKYGRTASERSLFIEPHTSPYIERLIEMFSACLSDYAIKGVEIWLGGPLPTYPHNDAAAYVLSGQSVVMQFWVLLEACVLRPDGIEEVSAGKNALECLIPLAPGVMFPGMRKVLSPTAGLVDYEPTGVVGGDDLSIGDVLLFRNGVIHEARGSGQVFRAALAFRAILKSEDDPEDIDLMLWLRDAIRQQTDRERRDNPHFLQAQAANPYFLGAQASWGDLPDRAFDPSRLHKRDRNDHPALRQRLRDHDFTY